MYVLFQPVGIACGLQSVALLSRGDIHFLCHGVLDEIGIECHLLVGAGDVFEGEIHQTIFLALGNIEEVVAIHLDVLHRDVVALAQRHVLAVAQLEELGPWADDEETACDALDVIHRYVLVMLRRIRAHLQPEHALCLIHLDVAEHNVAVFHAFAAKSQTAMHGSIMAVLDEHVIYRTILWCLVSPGSLTALDGDGIIVYAHVAAIYQHIMADINVDGIAAWCPHATGRGEDGAAQEADMVATVDVVGPERTVLDMYILQGYVA